MRKLAAEFRDLFLWGGSGPGVKPNNAGDLEIEPNRELALARTVLHAQDFAP